MKVLAGLFAALLTAQVSLAQTTITSTQLQSNFNGGTGAGQSAPITAAPFDFSSQPQLLSIDSISLTFTMIDGDTGFGPNGINDTPYPPDGNPHGDDDFDVNSLSLRLDGIDPGTNFLLNGFTSFESPLDSGDFVTVTFTGAPSNSAALLGALQDGFISATVFDSTGVANSNGFQIPNTEFDHSTPLNASLSFTGTPVPEPATILLFGAGALLLVWRRHRAAP
ncbi:MAG TPA: PEP-CTERM sorting domain-containing protein [Chthoniobacterales bacterium]|nr:PEP-CTERM sorting domain-containing protein [Chthoniobacterales bacterium]